MTLTTDAYIARVLADLPRDATMREQIALELRGTIAERLAHGEPEPEVLRHLGDPSLLAASYLSAIPLQGGGLVERAAAKAVDLALAVAVGGLIVGAGALVASTQDAPQVMPFAIAAGLIVGGAGLLVYTIAAEAMWGATAGKRLLGLQVVRETGGPIGVGQAIVRQLPWLFQVFWVDVLFVLFTDRRQRAFELLSKTRVIAR